MRGSKRPVEKNIFSLSSTGRQLLVNELGLVGDLLKENEQYMEDFYDKEIPKWNEDDIQLYFHSMGSDILLKELIERKRITAERIVEFQEEILTEITSKSKDEDKAKYVEDHLLYLKHVVESNKKKTKNQVIGCDFHYIHDVKIYKKNYEFWEEMAPQALVDFILCLMSPIKMKNFFFRNFLSSSTTTEEEREEEVEGENEEPKSKKIKNEDNILVLFCYFGKRRFFAIVLLGEVFITTSDHGLVIPMTLKDSKRLLDPKKMKKGLIVQERLAGSSLDDDYSVIKEKKIDKIEFVVNISLKKHEGENDEIGSVSVSPSLFLIDRLCHIFSRMNKERLTPDGVKSSDFVVRVCKEIGVHVTKIKNLNDKIGRIFRRRDINELKVL